MKVCSKCKIQKPLAEFGKRTPKGNSYLDGKQGSCKSCGREYTRLKLSDPVELAKHRERSRVRVATEEGRQKHREANLRYAKSHPNGSYAKQKLDSVFKLALNFRRLILINLKAVNLVKQSKTETVLGCDFEFLHLYIESQFTPDMTWANMGEWQIDHKIPISDATSYDEFVKLNHFSNLQPLWGKYNSMKSNKSPAEWAQYITDNNLNLGVRP